MTIVALKSILPGERINSRVTGRDVGLDELAASILAHGLLQPLMVRKLPNCDDVVSLVDGHRRLAAIERLVAEGKLESDINIPVHYGAFGDEMNEDRAREASLAANIVRVPLHPIDQFEAFAALMDKLTAAEIAERFGISEKLVRQRIALGALHPKIRQAWRDGKLQDNAAKAFTLIHNEAEQLKLFNKLQKQSNLYAYSIRSAIGADHDASKAVKIVGVDVYKAAGGRIIQDLFGEEHILSDPALAQKLLAEKLQAECDRLVVEEGWGFAVLEETVKDKWSWPKLTPSGKAAATDDEKAQLAAMAPRLTELEAKGEDNDGLNDAESQELESLQARKAAIVDAIDLRRWGPKQKKTAGCIVGVSHQGEIEIFYGVQNPKELKKKEKAAEMKKEAETDGESDAAPAISNTLALALSEQLTVAASETLSRDPFVALRLTVATLESAYLAAPLRLRMQGFDGLRADNETDNDDVTFEEHLSKLRDADDETVMRRLAVAVSKALDMRNFTSGGPSAESGALLKALDPGDYSQIMRQIFDAAGYFKSVNADLCHAALDEMGVEAKGRPKKKSELAATCVEAFVRTGWLPPQLRHPSAAPDAGDAANA
jgi:ParB family transcriptional regulator, chromosome partitioning protein